jgi:microcompartment protein CcmK/EutM
MAFMQRGASAADAEMERRVSVAARNLGDGVQKIVMAAKGVATRGRPARRMEIATLEALGRWRR